MWVLPVIFAGLILTEPLWHKKSYKKATNSPKVRKAVLNRGMNPLPESVDWQEVNRIIFPHWKNGTCVMNQLADLLKAEDISMTAGTRSVVSCLHDDIMWFYTNYGGYGAEYDEMESYLSAKYKGLDEKCIHKILLDYLRDFR